MSKYTSQVQKCGNTYFIVLPNELLDELDWHVDDVVEWIDNEDGTWSIVKVNDGENDD
jgi:antitoxin component of MazEF toxin-antitoxin module